MIAVIQPFPLTDIAAKHGWEPYQVRRLMQKLDIPQDATERSPQDWQRLKTALISEHSLNKENDKKSSNGCLTLQSSAVVYQPGQAVDVYATWLPGDRWLTGFIYLGPSRYPGKALIRCPQWFGNGAESTCDLRYLRPGGQHG